jgi:uracil-DNA glycosylase
MSDMTPYDALVRDRKACRLCAGLTNPASSPALAQYDVAEVGAYSHWLGSRPAKVALVAQDWATVGYYEQHGGRDEADNMTNQRLMKFLQLIGFNVTPPPEPDRSSGVFATNAILCLKAGTASEMSAPVKQVWFRQCRPFLKRTLDAVQSPVVIALGRRAFVSTALAFAIEPTPFLLAVEKSEPILLGGGQSLFAVYHPAARPVNRTLAQMEQDWRRIASALA